MEARGVEQISAGILQEVYGTRDSFETPAKRKLHITLGVVDVRSWEGFASHGGFESGRVVVGNEEDVGVKIRCETVERSQQGS
jgi:hypothetical protein